ncbi:hypothetical protein Q5P01_023360 [Channa striata]|uniref:Uncharacterized protein n=1 Tax=Channa striata TaxID=64152 RepID=A0AA88LQW6_CHASR|nr:hypothetical protein Q5P01_023360 [Channa striata]
MKGSEVRPTLPGIADFCWTGDSGAWINPKFSAASLRAGTTAYRTQEGWNFLLDWSVHSVDSAISGQ